jgi:hypothetical protein
VDISDGLLNRACELMSQNVTVPIGLLADFEGHLDFVTRHVRSYGKPPFVYGLLGGTFGNFDISESLFLHGLIESMNDQDTFLMDVGLYDEKAPGGNLPPDVEKLSEGQMKFFIHGASRALGIKEEEISRDIKHYIKATLEDGQSDVPNTKAVIYSVYRDGKLQRFAYIRRYTLDKLKEWLRNTFNVTVLSTSIPSQGAIGRALLIINKKAR